MHVWSIGALESSSSRQWVIDPKNWLQRSAAGYRSHKPTLSDQVQFTMAKTSELHRILNHLQQEAILRDSYPILQGSLRLPRLTLSFGRLYSWLFIILQLPNTFALAGQIQGSCLKYLIMSRDISPGK
ncbi:hypothetical protein SO802_015841 [Lithocarpus litseifolius]|uniref:Uncharacterized protein n=1 Tax=Lithocarpus litseifolius TaxID=425828 RepID=A0AAW2CY43_9ROSI